MAEPKSEEQKKIDLVIAKLNTLGKFNKWQKKEKFSPTPLDWREAQKITSDIFTRHSLRFTPNEVQSSYVLLSEKPSAEEIKAQEERGFYRDTKYLRVAYVRHAEGPAIVIPNPYTNRNGKNLYDALGYPSPVPMTEAEIKQEKAEQLFWIKQHPKMYYNKTQTKGVDLPPGSAVRLMWDGDFTSYLVNVVSTGEIYAPTAEGGEVVEPDFQAAYARADAGVGDAGTYYDTESKLFINPSANRQLEDIKAFVIHETAGTSTHYSTLSEKGAGVHFFINPDGGIIKSGDYTEVLVHAGNHNSIALGVEVVSPAIPDSVPNVLHSRKTGGAAYSGRLGWHLQSRYKNKSFKIWSEVIFSPGICHVPSTFGPKNSPGVPRGMYVLPPIAQCEGVYALTMEILEDPVLNVPRIFRGFNYEKGHFHMNILGEGMADEQRMMPDYGTPHGEGPKDFGQPHYQGAVDHDFSYNIADTSPLMQGSKSGTPGTGVLSHQNAGGHKDGSFFTLYVFIRMLTQWPPDYVYKIAKERCALRIGYQGVGWLPKNKDVPEEFRNLSDPEEYPYIKNYATQSTPMVATTNLDGFQITAKIWEAKFKNRGPPIDYPGRVLDIDQFQSYQYPAAAGAGPQQPAPAVVRQALPKDALGPYTGHSYAPEKEQG